MTRYKGASCKGQLTVEDLAELAEIHQRILRMISTLNVHATPTLPLMAAAATVKACWCEVSGVSWAWSYPADYVPRDGVPKSRPVQSAGKPE